MPKIGLVSTWGAYCGISTYAEQLGYALQETNWNVVAVAAPYEAATGRRQIAEVCSGQKPFSPYVEQTWRRNFLEKVDIDKTVAMFKEVGIDIVHIQHEFGLFPGDFDGFVAGLRRHWPVVLTAHTIFPNTTFDVDHLIVHTPGMLRDTDVGWNVSVIPHGIPENLPTTRRSQLEALEHFKLLDRSDDEGRFWLLSPGIVSPSKNVVNTVVQLSQLGTRAYGLILAGMPTGNAQYYVKQVQETARYYGVRVAAIERFVDWSELAVLYKAADAVVLNTTSRHQSASGQVGQALAFKKPVVAADRPIYDDATRYGQLRFHTSDKLESHRTFADAVRAVASDEIASDLAAWGLHEARRFTWSRLRPLYTGLYDDVLNGYEEDKENA